VIGVDGGTGTSIVRRLCHGQNRLVVLLLSLLCHAGRLYVVFYAHTIPTPRLTSSSSKLA
jgi:hypothetical protein